MNSSDEFDVFGQFVASELRQINSQQTRIMAKREIMQILLKYGDSLVSTVTQPTTQTNGHRGMNYPSNEQHIIDSASRNVYQHQSDSRYGTPPSNINYDIHNSNYGTDQLNTSTSYEFPFVREFRSNTYTHL